MNMYNHIAAQIKREFTTMYKEAFGKGPQNTAIEILEDVIVIKLNGFLTPLELAMHKLPNGAKKVEGIRDLIYTHFMSDLGNLLKCVTGKSITKILRSLNLDGDMEYIFIIMEGVIEKAG